MNIRISQQVIGNLRNVGVLLSSKFRSQKSKRQNW